MTDTKAKPISFWHPDYKSKRETIDFSIGKWWKDCSKNGHDWEPDDDDPVCFDWHCKKCGKYKDTF